MILDFVYAKNINAMNLLPIFRGIRILLLNKPSDFIYFKKIKEKIFQLEDYFKI